MRMLSVHEVRIMRSISANSLWFWSKSVEQIHERTLDHLSPHVHMSVDAVASVVSESSSSLTFALAGSHGLAALATENQTAKRKVHVLSHVGNGYRSTSCKDHLHTVKRRTCYQRCAVCLH